MSKKCVKQDFLLWRYIDLKKLEDMLKTSSLFFAFRKTFIDACEGKDSKYKQLQRKLHVGNEAIASALLSNFMCGNTGGTFITDPKSREECLLKNLERDLDNIGINCWTLHEDYNDGMPPRFVDAKPLNEKKYVGIKASYQNILSAFFSPLKEKDMLYHKRVEYHRDYDTAKLTIHNDWDHLFHMGYEWETEKEYRFILSLKETFNEVRGTP